MRNTLLTLAAAGLLIGSSAVAIAQTTHTMTSSPGASRFAPGHLQRHPGQARHFAPGHRQTFPGQARQFSPGHEMQGGTVGRGR
jgi:hypothetical protein